jgi:hypothetical protein
MSRTIQWCDGPTPRTSRPPAAAWAESACRANAIGCCSGSGTTAVPISIRDVDEPINAAATRASKSVGICGTQALCSPAASAHRTSSTSRATLRAESPRSGPIITPMRTVSPGRVGSAHGCH